MIVLASILTYLIGSIPFAYVIGKLFYGVDIRKEGSGNVGTTNAMRVFGKPAGLATFLLDMLKGVLGPMIGLRLAGVNGMAAGMLFVVIGHMFSCFLNFRSGKGVATSFGALLFIDYKYALIMIAIFIVIVAIFRIVSLASIALTIIVFISSYFYFGLGPIFYSTATLCVLVLFKHRSNIARLIRGEEKKLF